MPSTEPATNPFFVAGGTLSADAPSYVERQADRDLQAALRAGEYCYVLDSRQVGKSSLLIRAMATLRAEGIRVASCDLQRLGSSLTAEQFYQGLLVQIGRGIGAEREMLRTWQAHKEEAPFSRFRTALCEVALQTSELPLVVLVDEIELLRQQNFKTDEFLVGIRSFFTDRAEEPMFRCLTFCLAGSSTPDALIQNVTVTPFNIGKRIVPTDFTRAEAQPFADALSRTGRNGDTLLNRALYWTSGHPYLTQRVCKAILDKPDTRTAADVDAVVAQLYFGRDPEDGQHLSFINRRIEADPDFLMDPAALLAIYAPIYKQFGKRSTVQEDPKNHWHALLKLSGLVLPRHGILEIRNRVYHTVFGRAWIAEHAPDAEVVRQRVARRKGFLQAALLFGTIIAIMSFMAWTAIRYAVLADSKSRAANQKANEASNLLRIANLNLIQQAYEQSIPDIGRMQELLLKTTHSSNDFEWNYWNRLCHKDVMKLEGHTGAIASVAFSSDGRQIATGSWDRTAKVWDAYTGRAITTLVGHSRAVVSIAFSTDGKHIVTGSYDNTAKLWDSTTGREIRTFGGHKTVIDEVAISYDGKFVALASDDGTATISSTESGRLIRTLRGHSNAVRCVAYSSNGKRIVTGSLDHTAKVWDAATGDLIRTITSGQQRITSVAFTGDGTQIVTGYYEHTAREWDIQTGRNTSVIGNYIRSTGSERPIAVSNDGKRMVVGADNGTVMVLNTQAGRGSVILRHNNWVNGVAIASNVDMIVTTGEDGAIIQWHGLLRNSRILRSKRTLVPKAVEGLAFSPDGTRIVTSDSGLLNDPENFARVWEAESGRSLFMLKASLGIDAAVYSPDGAWIVTAGGDDGRGEVTIWDARTGGKIRSLEGHSASVFAIAVSPDSQTIVTGSYDKTAKVWDAKSGRLIWTLADHTLTVAAVAFSPDSRWIITGSWDKTAIIWDAKTGKNIRTLKGHKGNISSVAFSSDGRRIVTGSFDQTAKIWDTETGLETLTLRGHTDTVTSVAISSDNLCIVTGGRDNSARVWFSSPSN